MTFFVGAREEAFNIAHERAEEMAFTLRLWPFKRRSPGAEPERIAEPRPKPPPRPPVSTAAEHADA
jgi:hypothetical protein